MKKKSLKLNMILNAIKGIMGIIFPLITFPYVSRVLGVDNLGSFNFANSVISYFVLAAGLGISTYAIREGSRFRDDNSKFKHFADEMFTINMAATAVSYFLLLVFMIAVPKFANYKVLLIILSLQIVFKTIGIEWIYSIYEDYAYITARSIAFQVISLVLMFAFVRERTAVNIYAAISVVSGVGSNVLNYFHAKRYCNVGITQKVDWKRHMKPIMVLFAMSVTVTVYVSSDTTILGFLCSDYNVGIYSVATKIYGIVKTLLSSVLIVSIPRLSALLGANDKIGFEKNASDIYKTLITIMLPAMVGIIALRKEIVLIVSGEEFISAVPSLVILSIALIFCMGAWFWGQCILVPAKKENIVFKATVASALVNIILNFALIPFWKENAAAFTTLLAEAIAFFWCKHEGKKIIKPVGINKVLMKTICGCVGIVLCDVIVTQLKLGTYGQTIVLIMLAVVAYFSIELLLKNEALTDVYQSVVRKIVKRRS